MQVHVINNITKVYPTMIKVVVFREPRYYIKSEYTKRDSFEVSDDFLPQVSSLNRTKTLIRDIVLCNDFELFCTFTFDPKKVDSFSFPAVYSKMSVWLHHQRDLSRSKGNEFKYLCVPERHKSGRWHFHALISGYTSTLKDSGLKTMTLRPIYNITSFRSGFTTATPIDSAEAVSNYVAKYITKDFIKFFNKRRFFCSRNLSRPIREINSPIFSRTLPVFRKCVAQDFYCDEFVLPSFGELEDSSLLLGCGSCVQKHGLMERFS